eukprot:5236210-Alexandrium_andersonii.AAC.1
MYAGCGPNSTLRDTSRICAPAAKTSAVTSATGRWTGTAGCLTSGKSWPAGAAGTPCEFAAGRPPCWPASG